MSETRNRGKERGTDINSRVDLWIVVYGSNPVGHLRRTRAQVPHDPVLLAFCLERAAFETIHGRLVQLSIPLGNGPFDRSGGFAAKSLGARGMADSLYFYDPDEHNIEIRTYESR